MMWDPAKAKSGILLTTLLLSASATAAAPPWEDFPAPPGDGTMGPRLALEGDRLLLSWVHKTNGGARVSFARLEQGAWQGPFVVHEGQDVIANWADFPALHGSRNSSVLLAAWPSHISDEEGYGVRLSRSYDRGATWNEPAWLHDDLGSQEHGFATFTSNQRAVWLDGRTIGDGGAMQLLTRRPLGSLDPTSSDRPSPERTLDVQVCECCSIDTAYPHRGPVIVYRDRSDDEVRDIAIVRETGQGFTAPTIVAEEGWKLNGCPVQGPAISALGDRHPETSQSDVLLAAWYTAADDEPRIQVALSLDAGASFTRPMTADRHKPVGRVDAVLLDEFLGFVSWIDRDDNDQGVIKVMTIGVAGSMSPPHIVGETTAGRTSGFPKMEIFGDRLFIAWTEADGEGRTRVRVSARDVP